MRAAFRRWHIRLGWVIFVPLFFWLLSGFVMTLKPLSEVRSEALFSEPPPLPDLALMAARMPQTGKRPVVEAQLVQRADGPRWLVTFLDGGKRMADPSTGQLLPPLNAEQTRSEISDRLTRSRSIVAIERVDRAYPPHEVRGRKVDWRVVLDDDTHVYVDAESGEVVARRSNWWRFYDAFWRIHIFDYSGTDATDNPILIFLSALALVMTVMGAILLPRRFGRGSAQSRQQPRP